MAVQQRLHQVGRGGQGFVPAHGVGEPRLDAARPATQVPLRDRELNPPIGLIEPMTGALTTTACSLR
jgi:hypothetical protein